MALLSPNLIEEILDVAEAYAVREKRRLMMSEAPEHPQMAALQRLIDAQFKAFTDRHVVLPGRKNDHVLINRVEFGSAMVEAYMLGCDAEPVYTTTVLDPDSGWAFVPPEPTAEMIEAARKAWGNPPYDDDYVRGAARLVYLAMIGAAA